MAYKNSWLADVFKTSGDLIQAHARNDETKSELDTGHFF